jgi:hypothetical protein
MTYVASGGPTRVVALTLHADGRIERPDLPPARIDAGRLACADGSALLEVNADGRVTKAGRVIGRLTDDGAFAVDRQLGTWSARVRDDGVVELTTTAEGTTSNAGLRWEGFDPAARRTASLLTALLTPAFATVWCGSAPLPGPM